jgi:hypothetical protein
MMNWKGFGRKWFWTNWGILRHFSEGTHENHEKPVKIFVQDLNSAPPKYK